MLGKLVSALDPYLGMIPLRAIGDVLVRNEFNAIWCGATVLTSTSEVRRSRMFSSPAAGAASPGASGSLAALAPANHADELARHGVRHVVVRLRRVLDQVPPRLGPAA